MGLTFKGAKPPKETQQEERKVGERAKGPSTHLPNRRKMPVQSCHSTKKGSKKKSVKGETAGAVNGERDEKRTQQESRNQTSP